jgi:arylsulfatase A-like enzyme
LRALGCRRPEYACPECNVVLISIDTLRADHVGAYGYPRPTTPNIDALARRGVVFENAVSQSSWTRPAHMSMFTGLHPREHGFIGLSDRGPLDASVPTLAGELRRHGFQTVAFTGGINVGQVFGFDHGFDLFRSNGRYFRDQLEETRYWLEAARKGKFFLFWHGYDAHTPYASDPADRVALGLSERRPRLAMRRACKGQDRAQAQRLIEAYDAAIRRADRFVGKLIAELERHDLLRKTVVVVTSDHGEEFLEHGECFHINTLYREVLHVPLIVVAPGLAPRRVTELVPASVSIAPTILALAGVGEHSLPGISLLAAASGHSADVIAPVMSETRRQPKKGRGDVQSLTTPDRKLVRWVTLGRDEYFDSRTDLAELSPRADEEEIERLTSLLASVQRGHPPRRASSDAPPATATARALEERRELERQLRSLGYTE